MTMTAEDVATAVRGLGNTLLLFSARIHDALEIHRPCHRPGGVPTACERSHTDAAETPECVGCGYDSNDQPTPYPCPTALALGVPAPEPTQEIAP